ncbi:HAMP domain-containing histidine kinase [Hydrogenivirga sp. 128-5-R1-1]|uniref:sensor histidine kinase n=1 Tax=Hydrogenivirga sp. 128-5-R1-1 TaxID=392423 RepID=UPI00015F305F|nr:HAMP domain-containing histidine kinase [Hydrogenivirga sp. 128-5-R1-1]EDP74482.1 histidine kinase [Hydrogenivirga sp. 128-5-R1-1]
MKSEIKIFITTLLVIILSLSAINVIGILFLKKTIRQFIYDNAYCYISIPRHMPDYVQVSNELIIDAKSKTLITKFGDRYIYINETALNERIYKTVMPVLIWEALLIFVTMYAFQILVLKNVNAERERRELTEVMLLAITHKLGNFLASVRLNLSILASKYKDPPIERLLRSTEDISYSYQKTVNTLNLLNYASLSKEKIDIKSLIQDAILTKYTDKVILTLGRVGHIHSNKQYLEILLSNLVENAIKYSEKFVHIKVCYHKGKTYIFIRNDISDVEGGSGLGLRISKYIAQRLGIKMRLRVKRTFLVVLEF